MDEILFYKTCRHGNCGNNVTFHNKDERGYGSNLKNLETYNLERAQRQQDYNDGSWLLSKIEVDKFAVKHVDMQYLDIDNGKPSTVDELCVIQVNGVYDGNDIQFISELGFTFDLSKARLVTLQYAIENTSDQMTIWSKEYLDSISRDTFQVQDINKRKMMTKYGLKYRAPRKSKSTGKARGNCPTCGKITWDYNPYENAYCSIHENQ